MELRKDQQIQVFLKFQIPNLLTAAAVNSIILEVRVSGSVSFDV